MASTEMRKNVSKKMQPSANASPISEALALLTSQHREVEELFAEFESAGDKAYSSKKKIFNSLNEKLTLHMKLEESVFYPAAKKIDDDGILEAVEEHANVKSMLLKVSELEPSDESYDAKIEVLKELVEHHVEDEESEIFPECEKSMSGGQLTGFAKKMQEMMEMN